MLLRWSGCGPALVEEEGHAHIYSLPAPTPAPAVSLRSVARDLDDATRRSSAPIVGGAQVAVPPMRCRLPPVSQLLKLHDD